MARLDAFDRVAILQTIEQCQQLLEEMRQTLGATRWPLRPEGGPAQPRRHSNNAALRRPQRAEAAD